MRSTRRRRDPRRRALLRPGAYVVVATACLAAASAASAHIAVLPSQVVRNTATELTLEVPTERDVPTTAVRVMFPPEVTVYSFAVPPPGFTATPILARNGTVVGAVFRGTIPVGRYQTFRFLATAFSPGSTRWAAYQTYADGRIKPWTAAPEPTGAVSTETGPTRPGPAASVTVVASAAAAAGGGRTTPETGVWLGIVAIVIAAGAAVLAGLLWTTRPAQLPDDDGPAEPR